MPNDDMDFTLVVGKTIKLPEIASPTAEDVNKYHEIVIESYKSLFEKFKEKYAHTGLNAELEII
jgi:hypothetical protein